MKFSVIHPTARLKPSEPFPSGCLEAIQHMYDTCSDPSQVEYVLVVHESDWQDFWNMGAKMPAWGRFTLACNRQRSCFVDQSNAGWMAATGDIFVKGEDDYFSPKNWDREILARIPDTEGLYALQASTNSPRDHELYLPHISTRNLQRLIGGYDPAYYSMESDVDWSRMVERYGRVIPALDLKWVHRHPVFHLSKSDAVYERENAKQAYKIGAEVYRRRALAGFPPVDIPGMPKFEKASGQPVKPQTNPVIAFCTPGETFRMEWLAGRIELENALANAGYNVAPLLSYSSNVYKTRINLARSVVQLADQMGSPQYVFWLDDDNVVLPQQLFQLIRWLDQHPEADGIAGWCWIRKGHEWMVSAGNFTSDGVTWKPLSLNELYAGETSEERSEPKPITMTGFPCFLMRYSALKLLGPEAFRPILSDACDEGFTGEDGAFCNRALRRLNLFVHPMVHVQHLKLQGLEPDFKDEKIMAGWRETVNGKAITAPKEYSVPV